MLQQLAGEYAKAINGLEPKINIWNTSGDKGDKNDFADTITSLLGKGIPLLSNIKDQTGIDFLKDFKKDLNKCD